MIGVQASRRAKSRLVYAENRGTKSMPDLPRTIVNRRDLGIAVGAYLYATPGNQVTSSG